MAQKVIVPKKKYVPHFLKHRDIVSMYCTVQYVRNISEKYMYGGPVYLFYDLIEENKDKLFIVFYYCQV